MTDPAGTFSEWKANAVGGRNDKSMREFLEKHYEEDMDTQGCVKLAVRALLEVVDSGAKNMEVCVIVEDPEDRVNGSLRETWSESKVDEVVKEVEREAEEAKVGEEE